MLFGNNGESVFVDKTVVNTKYRTVLLLSDIFVMKKLLGLHFFLGDGFFAREIDRNLIRVKK